MRHHRYYPRRDEKKSPAMSGQATTWGVGIAAVVAGIAAWLFWPKKAAAAELPAYVHPPTPEPVPMPYQPPKPMGGGAPIDTISGQQAALRLAGYAIAVDGIRGPQTIAATKAFQTSRGLVADGIIGPLTKAALLEVVAKSTGGPAGVGLPTPTLAAVKTVLAQVAPGASAAVEVQQVSNTFNVPFLVADALIKAVKQA